MESAEIDFFPLLNPGTMLILLSPDSFFPSPGPGGFHSSSVWYISDAVTPQSL